MLHKNILATVIFFDFFDYPLTVFEIWKNLLSMKSNDFNKGENDNKKISILDILNELEKNNDLRNKIGTKNGFYFLKGKENLPEKRIIRGKISENYFKIARKAVKILRFCPFLRGIFITGGLAMKNATSKSDIDFLVVLKRGHIFTGRFFVTLITQLFGIRRHGKKIKKRICLNYFITDKSLKISQENIFSANEYSFAFSIYNFKLFRKFQKENIWIKNYKLNFNPDKLENVKMIKDTKISKLIKKISEIILGAKWIEKKLSSWQKKKIQKNPKTHLSGAYISVNENELIFLPRPQAPLIEKLFNEKIKEHNFSDK